MAAYRLMSTRHHADGSVEPPIVSLEISAADDRDADRQARHVPLAFFTDEADFAWLIDEAGIVVSSFPVAAGRAA